MIGRGLGVGVHTYDPSTQEQEDQEFKVGLPHMKPLKRAEGKTTMKENMGEERLAQTCSTTPRTRVQTPASMQ